MLGGVLRTLFVLPNIKHSSSILGALVALLDPTAKCAAGLGGILLLGWASRCADLNLSPGDGAVATQTQTIPPASLA